MATLTKFLSNLFNRKQPVLRPVWRPRCRYYNTKGCKNFQGEYNSVVDCPVSPGTDTSFDNYIRMDCLCYRSANIYCPIVDRKRRGEMI